MKLKLTREEFDAIVSKALTVRFKETFGFEFQPSHPLVDFSFHDKEGKDIEVISPITEIIIWKKKEKETGKEEKK